jgi:hypothetical protein
MNRKGAELGYKRKVEGGPFVLSLKIMKKVAPLGGI